MTGDPNAPQFTVPNIGLKTEEDSRRLGRRVSLRENIDNLQRAFDVKGELESHDQFETQAMTLLTSPEAKAAFDLNQEDDRTRDRYGRNTWSQQLLARRLVEAGVDIVTAAFEGHSVVVSTTGMTMP